MSKQNKRKKTETAPTEKEKAAAASQVLDMMESAWKPREQKDTAEWFVHLMTPENVKALAADWFESTGTEESDK